jgi:hypothetical protein
MLELRQEITSLRSLVNANANAPLPTPYIQYSMSPAISVQRPVQPATPISPGFQPSPYPQPMFVQGSSNNPIQPQSHPGITVTEPAIPAVTPAPSPLTSLESQPERSASPAPVNRKKRQTSDLSSEDEYNSDSSGSNKGPPLKRANHHDRRCLTVNVGSSRMDISLNFANQRYYI